jgi:hypothetical protein
MVDSWTEHSTYRLHRAPTVLARAERRLAGLDQGTWPHVIDWTSPMQLLITPPHSQFHLDTQPIRLGGLA